MEPLQQAFSVCSWVKKLRPGSSSVWFSYGTSISDDEITISDDGQYNTLFGAQISTNSLMTATLGKWYHYCLTWSAASQEQKIYVQGEIIKTASTASQRMLEIDPTNGYIVLGNDVSTQGVPIGTKSPFPFGGELTQLNVFSKEMSAQEVAEIWENELTLHFVHKFGATRYIKWEEILLWRRFGNVHDTEILLGNSSF